MEHSNSILYETNNNGFLLHCMYYVTTQLNCFIFLVTLITQKSLLNLIRRFGRVMSIWFYRMNVQIFIIIIFLIYLQRGPCAAIYYVAMPLIQPTQKRRFFFILIFVYYAFTFQVNKKIVCITWRLCTLLLAVKYARIVKHRNIITIWL